MDISATSKYYSPFYDDIFINSDPKIRRKYLLKFVKYYNGQISTGRVPSKIKNINDVSFAGRFGVHPPEGSKVVFLPKRLARKRISFSKKGVPTVWGATTRTQVYFLDFVTDEWLEELEELEAGDMADLREAIQAEVGKFVRRLPDGAMYSMTLATGDYAKGSTFDKKNLEDKLTDLILSYIRSKGVQELKDFVVAVNAVYPIKNKKKTKNKKRKRAKGK